MTHVSRPRNADNPDNYSVSIQRDVRVVTLEREAPGQHDRIGRVEDPSERERTFRPEPTEEGRN